MALDFTALRSAVAQETTLDQSVITLITQWAAQIQAANGDQTALNEIVGTMQSNAQSLSAAVTANTPAAPVVDPSNPAPGTTDTGPVTTAVGGLDGQGSGQVPTPVGTAAGPIPVDVPPATATDANGNPVAPVGTTDAGGNAVDANGNPIGGSTDPNAAPPVAAVPVSADPNNPNNPADPNASAIPDNPA